ncbi:MAG: universal stress protein [Gammaproteobacteria bacterium]|nr:universal stress protein [Gammaproteobacteria bacterium]
MLPKIKTILYCTSLGPHAPYIFGYACTLAASLDARIVALHVVETLNTKQKTLVDKYAGTGHLAELLSRVEKKAASEIPEKMRGILASVSGEEHWERLVKEIIIAEGRTESQILRHVESCKADLVVIGAHTEASIIDRLIGTTARSLIKSCPVPVLTVQVPG